MAEKYSIEERDRLLRERRLDLLVDLDQTLLHTTNSSNYYPYSPVCYIPSVFVHRLTFLFQGCYCLSIEYTIIANFLYEITTRCERISN